MDAQLTKDDFTSTEELDSLVVGDNTVEIIGYVDCVEGTKPVTTLNKPLYKCIINNADGRRIRLLIWDKDVATYEHLIKSRDIIRISRGKVTSANPTFFNPGDDIVPFEINTHSLTTIEILGKFLFGDAQDTSPTYVPVQLKSIADAVGTVCVQGYIKVCFEKQMSGWSTYGTGAITDGLYKLRVHISNLEMNPNLREGVFIQIKGTLKQDKFGANILHVIDMTDITILEGQLMSPAQLRVGYRSSVKSVPNVTNVE